MKRFWLVNLTRQLLLGVFLGSGLALAAGAGETADDGFRDLFATGDLSNWRAKKDGWYLDNGVLTWRAKSGFIWSNERFGDFILDLDFKVAPKTNSGILIRVGDLKNWLHTGIEVQVLDSYGKARPDKHDCGAIYDCLAPNKNAAKKAGEWNHITITCRGSHIDVVLNNEHIIAMNLDDWTEAHKNPDGTKNKFKTAYKGMPREGHIGFQDHGHPVWYRNVRIKELKDAG